MIRITITRTENGYAGFASKGHAGFAEKGSDIICAAVSALTINTVNSIEQFTSDAVTAKVSESGGDLRVSFPEGCGEKATLLMDSLVLGLTMIQDQYGKEFLQIGFRE